MNYQGLSPVEKVSNTRKTFNTHWFQLTSDNNL